MTTQYDHASKVVGKLRALGVQADVKGGEHDALLSVQAGARVFTIPPYAAYSYDAETTAEKIFSELSGDGPRNDAKARSAQRYTGEMELDAVDALLLSGAY